MPNWCSCEMVIYSPNEKSKDNLSVVYNKLVEAKNLADKHKLWHLYTAFALLNGDKPEVKSTNIPDDYCNNGYIRGTIGYIETLGDGAIRVGYDSAWNDMVEGWNYLLEKYNLKQVTKAIECGCELYLNTDKEGKYFPERYLIDCCKNNEYYWEEFETEEGAVKFFNEIYKQKFETQEQCIEWFENVYNVGNDNPDAENDFLNFYKYDLE